MGQHWCQPKEGTKNMCVTVSLQTNSNVHDPNVLPTSIVNLVTKKYKIIWSALSPTPKSFYGFESTQGFWGHSFSHAIFSLCQVNYYFSN
jgi:hypothetical protein